VFIDQPGGNYWRHWQEYVEKQLLGRGLIGPADLALYKITDNVPQAVEEVRRFYANYHSLRYSRDELILRLRQAPDAKQLETITAEFSDIKVEGIFRVTAALPVERDEPTLAHLPRLVFNFNRREHGRLRMLIDYLNTF
jgi:hypothetical protein